MNQKSLMLDALKVIMKETCEGPTEKGSYYTTSDPSAGLFGSLQSMTAEQVSQPVQTSEAPIVAHVYHTCYYLKVSNSDFSDYPIDYNDQDSWSVREVNEESWNQLRENLRKEYDTFMQRVEDEHDWTKEKATFAIAALAHTAYHLGSLRQMIEK